MITTNIDLTSYHYPMLKEIAKNLGVAIACAVAFAMELGVAQFYFTVRFFKEQVEHCPGSRLSREDMLAFEEWWRSEGIKWLTSMR